MKNISIFSNIRQSKGGNVIPIDFFLQEIRSTKWMDIVLDHRNGEKVDFPYVTISGTFEHRTIKGLNEHSGFICIDIDDVDPEEVKSQLCPDKYVYAAFESRSGKGVAAIFKINPKKHSESFDGLSQYLYEKYNIVIDPACRDVCRARFVSWDPKLYINEGADKFAIYPKAPPPALKKLPTTVFVQSDFDEVVQTISNRSLDITGSYQDWLRIGFAISDRLGESGRQYFHVISQYSPKYEHGSADKQYTNCLKHSGHGITISTFYYYCKQAGIATTSEQTKTITLTASLAKKGGRSEADTVKLLQDVEGIAPTDTKDIVKQVFENNIAVESDDSIISEVELFLRQNYSFQRNALSRKIEINGKPLENRDFNTIFCNAKKLIDKLTFETMDRIINSDFTPDYNPLVEFFESRKDMAPEGTIIKLCSSLKTDMPYTYVTTFVTKWLVGLVQSVFDEPCPLMLVLSGDKQGTGKTEFFRRLLPKEIRQYYAESKMDAGKDDEILMCSKLIIMDDEMGGKNKKEAARLKELTSKKWFSLREPYGRHNVDLRRLAILCGTTNENQILNDPTGNRRIIPIKINDIDHALYNSVDKTELLMEAYQLWRQHKFTADLSKADRELLEANSGDFQAVSIEKDLIQKYFDVPESGQLTDFLTTTDIKVKLEQWSSQRLNINKIGHELRNLGFEKVDGYIKNGHRRQGYNVITKTASPFTIQGEAGPF